MRWLPSFLFVACLAPPAVGQDALRGKLLYHDIGRVRGTGVSCVDCHGGIPGALHGLEKVAGNPNAIAYAIGAVQQMTPLRGRVTDADMADLAAYVANPTVASPGVQLTTVGPAASPYTSERLEFAGPGESSVRVTNAGALALQFGAAPFLDGPAAADFTLVGTDCEPRAVLAPQQSCAVQIAFRPAAPGLRIATLRFTHDWIGGGTNVALIGR